MITQRPYETLGGSTPPPVTKPNILLMNIRTILAKKRLCYLKREAAYKFSGVVHSCCIVSSNNHDLAFVIRRSVLGYPMVEQIKRPNDVMLHEGGDYVIVKDGYVFELTKRA